MIYQKAEELETAYRERHGLGDAISEDDDEQDSEAELNRGIKYCCEPAQYTRSAKTKAKNRFRYDTGEGSDYESDAGDSHISRNTRPRRSEPGQSSKGFRDNKKSNSRKDEALIRKFEKEIQRLRMGR